MSPQLTQGYKLVITGHSLGAGVASILALFLQPVYGNLVCYAYSPPGCTFRSVNLACGVSLLQMSVVISHYFLHLLSLPVVAHSQKFITSVVLGNDMVPRSVNHMEIYLYSLCMQISGLLVGLGIGWIFNIDNCRCKIN